MESKHISSGHLGEQEIFLFGLTKAKSHSILVLKANTGITTAESTVKFVQMHIPGLLSLPAPVWLNLNPRHGSQEHAFLTNLKVGFCSH